MRFSVLLPTRNRLKFLKYAVASVLEQNYENWEIIISDNFSEENIMDYILSLKEGRIKYYRTSSFISVTDNWNHALEKSTGDYVIMLGDDDCLLEKYFQTCLDLIHNYDFPDMLYTSAYIYAYPQVLPNDSKGYLETWENASFLSQKKSPYLLGKQERIKLVRKTLNFTVMFNFNAQFSLVRRSLIKQLQDYGPFYQSPYPDYYSLTATMLKANRVLAVPNRMVAIGISPKSFGYYYFNNKEKLGMEILKNIPNNGIYQNLNQILLPGTNMNSSWLFAMESVKLNFQHELKLDVNYRKYRFLQILHLYKRYSCKEGVTFQEIGELLKKLKLWEKFFFYMPFQLLANVMHLFPNSTWGRRLFGKVLYKFSHPSHGKPMRIQLEFDNILEVFRKMVR